MDSTSLTNDHAKALASRLEEVGNDLFVGVKTEIIVRASKGESIRVENDKVVFTLKDGREFSLPVEMVEEFDLITSVLHYNHQTGSVEWETARQDPPKETPKSVG